MTFLTLQESARFVGKICYVELQLFSVLAEKSSTADTPYEKVFFASASAAHAWRSRQLFELLPVSVGLPNREELIQSFDPDFDGLLLWTEAEAPSALLAILLQAIYPTLLLVYETRLEICEYPADAAAKRVFQRVTQDLKAILAEGNRLPSAVSVGQSAADVGERIVTLLRQLRPAKL